MRVAMVTTHPIQYQVPWLRMLANRPGIDLEVFFAMIPDALEQGREFGVAFQWDVPLLQGYRYRRLENVSRTPSLTSFAGCDTPGVGRVLRQGNFDAVIVNGWGTKTMLQTLLACRLAGVPCIVRGEANGLRRRAGWKRQLHRLLLSQYAAYLPIGAQNARYYRECGVDAARCFRTPYCVDNHFFGEGADRSRAAGRRPDFLKQHGLLDDRVTFLFCGKFVEKKRPSDLIAAFSALPAELRRRSQVLMVGDGPMRAELQARATGLDVAFSGFLNQTQMTDAYAASDVLVLPSDAGETWGLVVNEAMASGLPAMVSDQVGCAADLVADELTGWQFPCSDVSALSSRMAFAVDDARDLPVMGHRARRKVTSEFGFEQVVEGVMRALAFVEGGLASQGHPRTDGQVL